MNATIFKYGIYNNTNHGKARAGNVIPGGDPRFAHWLFPAWQRAPLATTSSSVFLENHETVGTRMQTIEKVLAAGRGGSAGAFTDNTQLS